MDEGVLTHTIAYVTNVWFCVKIIISNVIFFTYCYFQKVWNQYNEWKIPKNTLKVLKLVFLNNKMDLIFFLNDVILEKNLWIHSQI